MISTTDPLDELFPIVDEHDTVIGKIPRKEANSNPHIIHRAAGAFIYDPHGKLLLQKRSATKDTFPNCWDISTGGHVAYGDDYLETIVREIQEEVGIEVDPAQLSCLGKLLIKLPNENEFWQVYRYTVLYDVVIKMNTDEVAETRWVSIDELKKMQHDPQIQWSPKVALMLEKFLLKEYDPDAEERQGA